MIIERIEEWRLTPELEAEISALLPAAFGEDFGGRSFHKQRHHLRLIAREEGRIIGHMALCFRAVRLGGALTDIVGLADVCTAPEARGKGVAARLLARAKAEAGETIAPYFILFGTAGVYAAHGFRAVPNPVVYTTMDDARTGAPGRLETSDLMVLELGADRWPEDAVLDLVGSLI